MDSLQKDFGSLTLKSSSSFPTKKNASIEKATHQKATSTLLKDNSDDSDDESLGFKPFTDALPQRFFAIHTTVVCKKTPEGQVKHIKGSTLISIAHIAVKVAYASLRTENFSDEMSAYYCFYLPNVLPANAIKGIFHIRTAKDWIRSLGGWKGMIPSKERKEYETFLPEEYDIPKKFNEVKLFDTSISFLIKDGRLHLCSIGEKFIIKDITKTKHGKDIEITEARKKVNNQWISYTKTDLSYPQIIEAIRSIKILTNKNDSELSQYQIDLLSNIKNTFSDNEEHNKQIETFFHFLNVLMFGVESTGLNAGILTSLMTLELIANDVFTYEQAFYYKINTKLHPFGGFYPFANFGNNQGTYNNREALLVEDIQVGQKSMKSYRKQTIGSPIALKEAFITKLWLQTNNHLDDSFTFDEQTKVIKEKLIEFMIPYFDLDSGEISLHI